MAKNVAMFLLNRLVLNDKSLGHSGMRPLIEDLP
jgi:hypothetical protein